MQLTRMKGRMLRMKLTQDIENINYTKLGNVNIITFALFWTGMVVLCSLYVTIPLLPKLSEIYHISISQAAWAGSVFSICFAIGCLFFGAVSDRYGKKNVMVVGSLLWPSSPLLLVLQTASAKWLY